MVLAMEATVRAATGPAGLKQERGVVGGIREPVIREPVIREPAAAANVPVAPPTAPPVVAGQLQRRVRAIPVEKMPDVYDLLDESGLPISRASVQRFAVSQQIRSAVATAPAGVWVTARWNPDFGGYEIQGLAGNATS